jgi:hypothetical protein
VLVHLGQTSALIGRPVVGLLVLGNHRDIQLLVSVFCGDGFTADIDACCVVADLGVCLGEYRLVTLIGLHGGVEAICLVGSSTRELSHEIDKHGAMALDLLADSL